MLPQHKVEPSGEKKKSCRKDNSCAQMEKSMYFQRRRVSVIFLAGIEDNAQPKPPHLG